jgi:phosphoglycerate kinase
MGIHVQDRRSDEVHDRTDVGGKMKKLSVRDLKLEGKKVLVRVDFNVPLDEQMKITDDTRIRAALPTILHILDRRGIPILMSHLGRPKGKFVESMSLKPIAPHLEVLLSKSVRFVPDCIGPEVEQAAAGMTEGEVLLLENLRFYPEERSNSPEFAKGLAKLADLYVNDAFGTAHRAHASVSAIADFFEKRAAGFLMEEELKYLVRTLEDPPTPFITILGGAKISDKIGVIQNLLDRVDKILVGGGMAFTFLKSQGSSTGESLVEPDKLDLAREIMKDAEKKNVPLLLPSDCLVATQLAPEAEVQTVSSGDIPDGWKGLDIGPESAEMFTHALNGAGTIVWNGPMGVFESPQFEQGTRKLALAVASQTERGATTIIGGGDTVAAIRKAGVADKMSHISTGGGASLELLEGKTLPGIQALSEV